MRNIYIYVGTFLFCTCYVLTFERPTSCLAPGCKSNYKSVDRVTLFKMLQKPDQLRHTWVRALRRDYKDELKAVYVCVNHFRTEYIEYTHKAPNR